MMSDDNRTNVDRLRHDIDRGRTGDKVPWPDPALAPLGTDDEAAGTPPTAGEIQLARRAEGRRPDQPDPTQGPGYAWILIGFILSLFAGVAIWLLMAH